MANPRVCTLYQRHKYLAFVLPLLCAVLALTCVSHSHAQSTGVTMRVVSTTTSSVSLSWSADPGLNVTSYTVGYYYTGASSWRSAGLTTSYTFTRLSSAQTYTFQVKATTSTGTVYSNAIQVGPNAAPDLPPAAVPTAPTTLSAVGVSATQINLQWNDASGDESGFKVERANSATGPWVQIVSLPAGSISHSNTGLATGTTYYYRVCAHNSAGNSAYSPVASATTSTTPPAAPAGLYAVTASGTQINLTWTDKSTNELGFTVQQAAGSAGPFVDVASVPANTRNYSCTGLTPSTKYFYRVCAYNSGGKSPYTTVVAATTTAAPPSVAPSAPASLAATAVSANQINLEWTDNSDNESGFRVERSTSDTGTFTQVATIVPGKTVLTQTNLVPATTYYYRVYAYNAAGNSGFSPIASARTHDVVPVAPASTSATAISSSQIDVAWTDSSNNEAGFRVESAAAAAGPFAEIGSVAAGVTKYSHTGLPPVTTRYYRVRAYNSAGVSNAGPVASATTKAVAPSAPIGLSANAVSTSQITLTWVDGSDNETGFRVERASTSAGPFSQITVVAAGTTTYSSTGLSASTTYCYRVCAYNSVGNSPYSAVACATTQSPAPTIPAAPAALSASAVSTSQINLVWTDSSSDETGFSIERAASGGTYAQIATAGANTTTYASAGLAAGTAYSYRVRAFNSAGNSPYSPVATATTMAPPPSVPDAPAALSASALSDSQIKLIWQDKSSNETGFKVERAASASGPFAEVAALGANVTTWSNTGLSAATSYHYRVCAYNAAGASAYSATATATTGAPALAAPSNASVEVLSSSSLKLTWTDNSTSEFGFGIERAVDGGAFASYAIEGAGSVNFTDSNLQEGTVYRYRLYAYGISGYSSYSNEASDKTKLNTPTNLAAVANSPTEICLTWTDNSNKEQTYCVERKDTGDWTVLAGTLPANSTSYTDASCVANTSYYYRVTAKGSTSDPSNVAVVTTPPSINPQWIGHVSVDHLDSVYCTYDVAVGEQYVYAASYSGLSIYSIPNGDDELPALVSQVDVGIPYSVVASKINGVEYAFLTEGRTLKVVRVGTPIVAVSTVDLPGYGYRLCHVGNYVYVACGADGVAIFDVTSPEHPTPVGRCDTDGQAWAVDCVGTVAVVADGSNGLVTLDVSNPANPAVIGHVSLPSSSVDVDVEGNSAWLALVSEGLCRVDISVPSVPSVARTVSTTGAAIGVCVEGSFVFAACNSLMNTRTGVEVFESRAGDLQSVAFLQTIGWTSYQVAVRDRKIYLSDNAYLADVATY